MLHEYGTDIRSDNSSLICKANKEDQTLDSSALDTIFVLIQTTDGHWFPIVL